MTVSACLPEAALWPAADDASLSPVDAAHLRCCRHCALRVAQLREQRRRFRDLAGAPASGWEPAESTERSSRDGLPQQIGGYPVQHLLKLGGQAEVYLARHPDSGADVVVKWSHARVSRRPTEARRLADEARFLSRLRDPRLVQVLDLGIAEGRPFVVLEHIPGSELGCDAARPLRPRDAARLVAEVARCLQVVHDAGRLHLDVQPGNILIDADGRPRLIDFGLSLPCSAQTSGCIDRGVCGTPEYMAPEQLAGDVARLTPATDVYGLGAVLHELLTGAPPQPELLWTATATAPGLRNAATPAAVPESLLRLCRRALDPAPSRRFATALEFARALERCTDRRRRLSAHMIGGMVAILLVGAAARLIDAPGSSTRVPPAIGLGAQTQSLDDALRSLLIRPTGAQRPGWLVLPDGRQLPVNLQGRDSDGSPPPYLVEAFAAQLVAIGGTSVVLAAVSDADGAPPSPLQWNGTRLPTLPPGTIVQMTDQEIVLLATGGDAPPTRVQAQALEAALRGLHAEVRRAVPRCNAVVVAGGVSSHETRPRDVR